MAACQVRHREPAEACPYQVQRQAAYTVTQRVAGQSAWRQAAAPLKPAARAYQGMAAGPPSRPPPKSPRLLGQKVASLLADSSSLRWGWGVWQPRDEEPSRWRWA